MDADARAKYIAAAVDFAVSQHGSSVSAAQDSQDDSRNSTSNESTGDDSQDD
jgi:hypothetical protein